MNKIFTILISLAVVFSISLLSLSPAVFAVEYIFTPIDVPDATLTQAFGINNLGQIVGGYNDPNAPNTNGRGFLLSRGTFNTFDAPGIQWPEGTVFWGINDAGQIVGSYGYGPGQRGFQLSGNTFTTIEIPGADTSSATYATGINNLGQIVGIYYDATNRKGKSFLLSGNTLTTIEVPGATYTEAYGINDVGQIVGRYQTEGISGIYGFLFSGGNFSTIDAPVSGPGTHDTEAYGINNHGDIVGVANYPGTGGFLLSGNTFSSIDLRGANPRGINDAGQIVGFYESSHGFLATPSLATITVTIDIRPWSKRNPINYKGHGILPVAILSTDNFDATSQLDQNSLTFGATGDEKSLAFCNRKPRNVSRDGSKDDLVCHFYIEIAGFKCGDTEGILNGKTISGIPIEGEDLVRIINCK